MVGGGGGCSPTAKSRPLDPFQPKLNAWVWCATVPRKQSENDDTQPPPLPPRRGGWGAPLLFSIPASETLMRLIYISRLQTSKYFFQLFRRPVYQATPESAPIINLPPRPRLAPGGGVRGPEERLRSPRGPNAHLETSKTFDKQRSRNESRCPFGDVQMDMQ